MAYVPSTQSNIKTIGKIDGTYIQSTLGISMPSSDVFLYPGTVKHIKRRGHGQEWNKYHHLIPDIIANPDYIGQNPKEPDSLEFYKDGLYLLVAIKWDSGRKYYYLSSFYQLNNGKQKIQKRISSNRIVQV